MQERLILGQRGPFHEICQGCLHLTTGRGREEVVPRRLRATAACIEGGGAPSGWYSTYHLKFHHT